MVSNLVKLISYVYVNTDSLVSEEEPLRELVTTCLAQNFRHFEGEEVGELMEQGGDFVLDFWGKKVKLPYTTKLSLPEGWLKEPAEEHSSKKKRPLNLSPPPNYVDLDNPSRRKTQVPTSMDLWVQRLPSWIKFGYISLLNRIDECVFICGRVGWRHDWTLAAIATS
ncbi:hypothetical protein OEA41_000167 [Lepraria neglecta]|uniref:Uncharacterized protein n=1 Tax=Lepraria neglecta TaxID=209136 RepID=A0AAD9ZFZ3_9LECA|nr:hypothetical protein OEA41_000167 [Lepraria neglecta]